MPKSDNQRLKLIHVRDILLKKTDDQHGITMHEIIAYLNQNGIEAERKSIYKDLYALKEIGMKIESYKENGNCFYYLNEREFELPELKLLVDAVQSSKFITAKLSNNLIKKIENLTSVHNATQLQRQVHVSERIKTMNESIYSNVDAIHAAINTNMQIRFQYTSWSVDKKMKVKQDGKEYIVSPWEFTWSDENYYLISYNSEKEEIRHYRVDKMKNINIVEEKRDGKINFENFDIAIYTKKLFGMFKGKLETVGIEFENSMANVIFDRFGKNIMLLPKDEHTSKINVEVEVSRLFLAWIMGLGSGVKIISPECVVSEMKEEIERLRKQYE